jgi:protocatechuate 3,4-dioxygenase, beta subunit
VTAPTKKQPVETQADLSAEIAKLEADSAGQNVRQPLLNYPPYRSSILRHPTKDPRHADPETIELWAPCFGNSDVDPLEADLTIAGSNEPIGERITVSGRVTDGDGRPVRNQLVEIWQANSAGRYIHKREQHPAPLDPNFTGVGRCVTDDEGRYRFITIKPGAYPWRNHPNAWRAAHIHFSLFGRAFPQRLVTQMYFPGEYLFFQDPIYNAVPDERARQAMISRFDLDETVPEWALAFQWDVVLTGRDKTPLDEDDH